MLDAHVVLEVRLDHPGKVLQRRVDPPLSPVHRVGLVHSSVVVNVGAGGRGGSGIRCQNSLLFCPFFRPLFRQFFGPHIEVAS